MTMQMKLGELVERLADVDTETILRHGLYNPHSYRGYYDQLAFTPCGLMTAGDILEFASGAIGRRFEGYKGGSYLMSADTPVWLAAWGDEGEELTAEKLATILTDKWGPGLPAVSVIDAEEPTPTVAESLHVLASNVAELTELLCERLPERPKPVDPRCFNCGHVVYEHHDDGCTYMLGAVAYGERRCRCQIPRAIHDAPVTVNATPTTEGTLA